MKALDERLDKGGRFLFEETNPQEILIPEEFNDEIKMIAKTCEQFVENEIKPNLAQLEKLDLELSRSLMEKAAALGLLGIEIPEAYDGMELSKLAATVVAEKLAPAGGFNTTISSHLTIGTLPLVYFGTDEQKRRYLPKLCSGEWIAAYALTEPEAGSDALGGCRTLATLSDDGKHYVLNGTKMWISNAGFADMFTVFAKVDGERKKFSAFLVERSFAGLSNGAEEKKMGIKASSTTQLMLENIKVPVDNVLGEIGDGAKIAFNILNIGRFKLGAGCVGGAKVAMRIAADYALERHQFEQPLASFGLIQEKLADMAVRTFVVESAVYRTIGYIDEAYGTSKDPSVELAAIEAYAIECSMIKVLGSELLDFVVDEGVQIHGGYGYSQDYTIEHMYRDSRINRIYEGTNEINRLLTPGMVLKRAANKLLPLFDSSDELDQNNPSDYVILGWEMAAIRKLKRATVEVLVRASQKYGQSLHQEQEVLARVADLMMTAYAAESAALRTIKLNSIQKNTKVSEMMVRVYLLSQAERVIQWVREAFSRFLVSDDLKVCEDLVQQFRSYHDTDVIGLKRKIAKNLLNR